MLELIDPKPAQQGGSEDVEMELEPDMAERVRRRLWFGYVPHNATRRGKKMRSEDVLDELSEVRSDVSSSVVDPRSEVRGE